MAGARPSLGLRGRLLLVLLAMVLPMAAVGGWLARSTQRSGEALLRERLAASLTEATHEVAHRWIDRRSRLLSLAENDAVVRSLAAGRPLDDADGNDLRALERDWAALEGVADSVAFRGVDGIEHGALARPGRPTADEPETHAPVAFAVHEPVTGERVGTMETLVRVHGLLPVGFWWSAVGGAVPALFAADGAPLLGTPMQPELLDRDRFQWGGSDWIVVRRRLHEPPLSFAVAAPLDAFTAPFAAAAWKGAAALGLVLLASFLLATLLSRRLAGPIEQLATAADAIATGDLERRVAEAGPREVRRLGRAFNTMTESLRGMIRRMKQQEAAAAVGEFAGSLAHEVRNPLTSIRLDLERARERLREPERADALLDRALRDVERLDATVTGSLRVARSATLELGPVDLLQPLRAAARAAAPIARDRDVRLIDGIPATAEIPVRGNAGALEQLFLNLLINAADAAAGGGTVSLAAETDPAHIRVTIRDDGPGIPQDQLARIFEPFHTTKPDGTGLGLPIAWRIAAAHDGELRIESEPGCGTVAEVVLPRAGRNVPSGDRNESKRSDPTPERS